MENSNEINRKIANNLIRFRKAAGYTQAELAEKINYSDKSVSKWDSGNGIPDVYTLMQLAELYGVTIDAFVGDETPIKPERTTKRLRSLITILSSGIIWLVATSLFVILELLMVKQDWWLVFVYAVVLNAILLIVFAGVWRYRVLNFIGVSTLIWTAITCLYLTIRSILTGMGEDLEGLWLLFAVGVPLQALEIAWVFFRSLLTKQASKLRRRTKRGKLAHLEEKK